MDKLVKVRTRNFVETFIEGIENYLMCGNPKVLKEAEELFKPSRIFKSKFLPRINSYWKLKLESGKLEIKELRKLRKLQKKRMKDLLQCPMCRARGKDIKYSVFKGSDC